MRVSVSRIKDLCLGKGYSLKDLLSRAGVSKTAYYHLIYKDYVLPRSIHDLAEALGVEASAFLEEKSPAERQAYFIIRKTDEIMEAHPSLDRENVRHTLLLLQEEPIKRLRRALIRGRRIHIHE